MAVRLVELPAQALDLGGLAAKFFLGLNQLTAHLMVLLDQVLQVLDVAVLLLGRSCLLHNFLVKMLVLLLEFNNFILQAPVFILQGPLTLNFFIQFSHQVLHLEVDQLELPPELLGLTSRTLFHCGLQILGQLHFLLALFLDFLLVSLQLRVLLINLTFELL